MKWIDVKKQLPTPDARILIWFGDAMFGTHNNSEGWAFDFLPPDSAYALISHFCEVNDPAVCSDWIPISEHSPIPGENVALWCGYAVVGYQSEDLDDPERDEDGWVIDYRTSNMSKPTHVMRIVPPAP